jgi:hypothetical protein
VTSSKRTSFPPAPCYVNPPTDSKRVRSLHAMQSIRMSFRRTRIVSHPSWTPPSASRDFACLGVFESTRADPWTHGPMALQIIYQNVANLRKWINDYSMTTTHTIHHILPRSLAHPSLLCSPCSVESRLHCSTFHLCHAGLLRATVPYWVVMIHIREGN